MSDTHCAHDLVVVEDRDLPQYCWFSRCRKCGAECSDPSELESDTPITDAMIQPVPGRDCVTGAPIDVVHADDCRKLERELAKSEEDVRLAQIAADEWKEAFHRAAGLDPHPPYRRATAFDLEQ